MKLIISALNMKAVCSFETLVPTYKFTRCHNPEDYHGHLHQRNNFKSQEDYVDLPETMRKKPHYYTLLKHNNWNYIFFYINYFRSFINYL
jgi:hypothetical protein